MGRSAGSLLLTLSIAINIFGAGLMLHSWVLKPKYELGTCLLDPTYSFTRVVGVDTVNRKYSLNEQLPERVFNQELVSKGEDSYSVAFAWADKTYMVVPCRLER